MYESNFLRPQSFLMQRLSTLSSQCHIEVGAQTGSISPLTELARGREDPFEVSCFKRHAHAVLGDSCHVSGSIFVFGGGTTTGHIFTCVTGSMPYTLKPIAHRQNIFRIKTGYSWYCEEAYSIRLSLPSPPLTSWQRIRVGRVGQNWGKERRGRLMSSLYCALSG